MVTKDENSMDVSCCKQTHTGKDWRRGRNYRVTEDSLTSNSSSNFLNVVTSDQKAVLIS